MRFVVLICVYLSLNRSQGMPNERTRKAIHKDVQKIFVEADFIANNGNANPLKVNGNRKVLFENDAIIPGGSRPPKTWHLVDSVKNNPSSKDENERYSPGRDTRVLLQNDSIVTGVTVWITVDKNKRDGLSVHTRG